MQNITGDENKSDTGQVESINSDSIFAYKFLDPATGYPFPRFPEIANTLKKIVVADGFAFLNINLLVTIKTNQPLNISMEPQSSISNLPTPQILWETPEYLKHFY